MGRRPCCDKVGLKKGPWTAEEDKKLVNFIVNNGHCCWRLLPKLAGLLRCGKSCRLRWTNYLRPDLKRGVLSQSEETLIIDLHARIGNRWSKIASHLPGRTDNEIKNYWNTYIKKKLRRMGIDPVTHLPLSESPQLSQQNNNSAEANELCVDEEERQKQIFHENVPQEPKQSDSFSEAKQSNSFSSTEIPCKMEESQSIQSWWEYSDIAEADYFENSQYGITWLDSESNMGSVFDTPGIIPPSSDSYNAHLFLQSLDNINSFPPWEIQPGSTAKAFYQN